MKIVLKPTQLVFIVIAAVVATLAVQLLGFTALNYISYCIEKNVDYFPAFLNIFSVFISSLISATIALIVVHIQINSEREKNKEELQRKTILSLKMIFQELEYNKKIIDNVILLIKQKSPEESDIREMLLQLSNCYWMERMNTLELNDETLLPELTSIYFKLKLIQNSPERKVNSDTLTKTNESINKLTEKINSYLQNKGA